MLFYMAMKLGLQTSEQRAEENIFVTIDKNYTVSSVTICTQQLL
jgi:uncharacterized protein YuzE